VLPEYTRIAEQGAKTDRASAAEALLRVGMCQERNRDPRAKDSYSRITEQFASEKIFAEDAKRRLIALRASVNSITPAATFLIRQPSGGSA
jgi:hypothetical protein